MRRVTILQLTVGLLWFVATAARSEAQSCPIPGVPVPCTLTTGTAGGAQYVIAVPTPWNGYLVIWNHGFQFESQPPDLGPLVGLQLTEGFAVAASSFQQAGWALFKTQEDLLNLVAAFTALKDPPAGILMTGASLGALASVRAIEEGSLGSPIFGSLNLCGAVGGSRNWDGSLDFRLTYDAVCGRVRGAFLPGGAEGLPAGSTLTKEQIFAALDVCTGVVSGHPTPPQIRRLLMMVAETGIPPSFLPAVLRLATLGMEDLVHDPEKLDGEIGTGNANVVYDLPPINNTIERVSPDPEAEQRLLDNYTPTGSVGVTKIVSMHTDKDGLVIVENESEYASVVPPSNLTTAIVVEAVPSHCGFTPAEGVAAWESLRLWVTYGLQPSAYDIQLRCQSLVGTFAGPCRIDPDFKIADMDGRIPPR